VRTAIVIAVGAALFAGLATAQTQRSGGTTNASPQIMQQYQQLASERTALANENAKLKKDLQDAQAALAKAAKERDALKGHVGGAAAELARARSATESAEASLARTKDNLDKLLAKAREIAAQLAAVETDRGQIREQLAARNREYDVCVERNVQLYDINNEILDRYEHVSPFTRLAAVEPFTRLKRTQLENLVDAYKDRAQELKLQKSRPPAPAAGPPAPAEAPPGGATP
jgi:chromosome segregation ATPase